MINEYRYAGAKLFRVLCSKMLPILPIIFLFLFLSPMSGFTSEDDPRDSTLLEDKLNNARGIELSESYMLTGKQLAQSDDEQYFREIPGQDSNIRGAGGYYGNKDWQAFVALYLWFVGMNGDIGKGDFVAGVDIDFGDIWDNLDFGLQAHIEVWWKKVLFIIDPMYMNLSSSNSNTRVVGSLRSKVDIDMFLMDIAAGYRALEIPLGSKTKSNNLKTWPSLAVDLYGGGRLISLDSDLRLRLETPIGIVNRRINLDETWFDFIVGSRLFFDFTENLLLTLKSDIGGFGLGFSSDIDWNFVANVGYQLPWYGITPYIGYRVLYLDYKDGSGDQRFVYDVWHTGPQVGVGVRF